MDESPHRAFSGSRGQARTRRSYAHSVREPRAFEETLLEQFIQCIGIYPVGGAVELNTGEAGLVIAQNPLRRLLPRVMVMLDAGGKRMHYDAYLRGRR